MELCLIRHLENSPREICDCTDWLKIVFVITSINRNTELALFVDVMMAWAKRIYILMIKVTKLFSFFCCIFFKRKYKTFSLCFYNYTETWKSHVFFSFKLQFQWGQICRSHVIVFVLQCFSPCSQKTFFKPFRKYWYPKTSQ